MGYLLVEFIQLTVPHKSIPNVNISSLISKQVYKDVTRTTSWKFLRITFTVFLETMEIPIIPIIPIKSKFP